MKNLKIYKWKVTASLLVFSYLILLLVVIRPAIVESIDMYNEKKALLVKIDEAMGWEKRVNKIEEERAAIDAFFAGITVEMPDEYLMSTMIERFFSVAESNHVVVRRIQPLDPIDNETHLNLPFELQVSGTYHNIIKVVNNFEKLGYWLNPDRIYIQSGMSDDIENLHGDILINIVQIKFDEEEQK